MFAKVYYRREMIQLGYVTLVSIAVAFTTIAGAASSSRITELKPYSDTRRWDTCLVHDVGEVVASHPCDAEGMRSTPESVKSVFNSGLVNASINQSAPNFHRRELRAD